ncbi:MAG: glycosyltransferase family 4 protein [Lachnospiraceae bacterium]|nr:glycosyltransferase family 4 protein [Lachnospiraceae bacterium]
MVFVTLFTRFKNVHFLKDVGMIPYHMHRDHGCVSIIAANRNEEAYPYLEEYAKGVRMHFFKGRGISYILRNAKKIDILNVYHLNLQSFFLLLFFKGLRKKGAKSYLKLDMDERGLKRLFMKNPVGFIKRRTVGLADVVSAETEDIYGKLKESFGKKIIFVTNGYHTEDDAPQTDFEKKKEILTVGMLGTEAKATDVLIKAFVKAAGDRKDWTLRLAGPVDDSFVNPHPDDDRIVFEGEIRDRERLKDLYRDASVFAFPSRHESFGIVMLEAASCGDMIVSTKGVPAARDILKITENGRITDIDDVDALAGVFRECMESGKDWNAAAQETARLAFENYRWEEIVDTLAESLL